MSRNSATSDVFSAIADPTRRSLLDLLEDGDQPVTALASRFKVTVSAVSQHLRLLREAGLVTVRKAGRERWYHLNPAHLLQVATWVAQYERFWHEKLNALDEHLRRNP